VLLLFLAAGCAGDVIGQTDEIRTTISGAKRFDHFSVTNLGAAQIQARVVVFKEGTSTPIVNQILTVPGYGTRGKVVNVANALAWKAECRVGGKVCTVEVKKDSGGAYDFSISSATFVVESATKMSGEGVLVAKDMSRSEVQPQE
jgi:hypothetical protein